LSFTSARGTVDWSHDPDVVVGAPRRRPPSSVSAPRVRGGRDRRRGAVGGRL